MPRHPLETPPSASRMRGILRACRNLKDRENSSEERHRQSYNERAEYRQVMRGRPEPRTRIYNADNG